MPPTTQKPKGKPEVCTKKKFKVMAGSHAQMKWVTATEQEVMAGIPGLVKKPDGKFYRLQVTNYERGQDVESDRDLDKEFNINNHQHPHLMRVGMNGQPLGTTPNPWDFLENKTVEQLKGLATFHEIELGEAKTKEQILKVLTDYRDGIDQVEQV